MIKADQNLKMTLVTVMRTIKWRRIKPGKSTFEWYRRNMIGLVVLDRIDIERLSAPYVDKDDRTMLTVHMLAELVMGRSAFWDFRNELREHDKVDIDYDRVNYCFYLKPLDASWSQNRP